MSDDIYQTDLLRLAAEARGAGRLDDPQASVTLDNPLCGDRVTLDLNVTDGQVSELGHEVKACLLCQASAALIGAHAAGETPQTLRRIAAGVRALLSQPDAPAPPWPGLDAFRPVARHKSRHACVLLPFRALDQALTEAGFAPEP